MMSDEPETLTLPLKLSSSLSLKRKNIGLCIICQNVKDSQGCGKLTSTHDGRSHIIETSKVLNNDLIVDLSNAELSEIKYHVKTCYARYKRSGERHVLKRTIDDGELSISSDSLQSSERAKRAKIAINIELKDKPCIVCNQVKFKGIKKRLRICEYEAAKNLLKAVAFNKDVVHTRCILYKTVKDVYAADVMYYANCFKKYIRQFQRDVEDLMKILEESNDNDSGKDIVFEEVILKLELDKCGYALSDIRDLLNEKLEEDSDNI